MRFANGDGDGDADQWSRATYNDSIYTVTTSANTHTGTETTAMSPSSLYAGGNKAHWPITNRKFIYSLWHFSLVYDVAFFPSLSQQCFTFLLLLLLRLV